MRLPFSKVRNKLLRWTLRVVVGYFVLSIVGVLVYAVLPVYVTPLMGIRAVQHIAQGRMPVCHHQWVPYEAISRSLKRAVVASEDNLFQTHNGFDFRQIQNAIEESNRGKRSRGASTITQQTAKNVFLWNGGGFFRKALEAYYTVLIELIWSKRRIMEVYLNSIEMGDGIYGAEAVAREHFHKPAKRLTAAESALIAATLPNPIRFNSAKPSGYVRKRQAKILYLMPLIAYEE